MMKMHLRGAGRQA